MRITQIATLPPYEAGGGCTIFGLGDDNNIYQWSSAKGGWLLQKEQDS